MISGTTGNMPFILPPNFILFVCAGIVIGIIGFVVYGLIKGFENVFPEE